MMAGENKASVDVGQPGMRKELILSNRELPNWLNVGQV